MKYVISRTIGASALLLGALAGGGQCSGCRSSQRQGAGCFAECLRRRSGVRIHRFVGANGAFRIRLVFAILLVAAAPAQSATEGWMLGAVGSGRILGFGGASCCGRV